VPADGCGEGFVHDGEYGCEPVLPADACEKGQMAIPGEDACRLVSECAGGTWGSIPVDGSTVYVDGSYVGVSTGSASQPFLTVQEAVSAATNGAIVAIAAGTYAESVDVDRSVVLWGVCPSEVTIDSPGGAAIDVNESAASVIVRDLGCSGQGRGVHSRGAPDLLLERVWIHHTANVGVQVATGSGAATVTLRDSLIERAEQHGLLVRGAAAVVERSQIRGATRGDGTGSGITGVVAGDVPSSIAVRRSLVEDSPGRGIDIQGSTLVVEGSVLRDQRTNGDLSNGAGITGRSSGDVFGSVIVRQSLVEASRSCGICAHNADLVVERSVVRDIITDLAGGHQGVGIRLAGSNPESAQRPQGRVEQSLIERVQLSGVRIIGSDAEVAGLVVRHVDPPAGDGTDGRGITVEYGASDNLQRSSAQIRGCRVEHTHEAGIFVIGSDATIDSCAVLDTEPRTTDGLFGSGLVFTPHINAIDERAVGTVARTVVERAHAAGILVAASEVDLSDVIVRDTLPQDDLDDFGDGLVASSTLLLAPGHHPTELDVTRTTIVGSARAGLAAFAAPVTVQGSWFDCNRIQINGEQDGDEPFSIADDGGNVCGCGEETEPCQVLSSGLAPPPGL
jgi:hypothetical protein